MTPWHNGVAETFWPETAGWHDDERTVALYLLTCTHRKTEGLYRLPAVYAAHDMGWPVDRFVGAVRMLADRGWLIHESDWVLLVNGLRWNPPKSPSQIKGARNAVESAPRKGRPYRVFYTQAEAYCDPLFQLLDPPADPTPGVPRGSETVAGGGIETSTPTPTPTPTPLPTPTPAPTAAQDATSTHVERLLPLVQQRQLDDPRVDGSDLALLDAVKQHGDERVSAALDHVVSWATGPGLKNRSLRRLLPSALTKAQGPPPSLRALPGGAQPQQSEFEKAKAMTERLMAEEAGR